MARHSYTNEDGSVRAEVLAEQAAARAASAAAHGVDERQVEALLAAVQDDGYVIIPDLISRAVIDEIRTESEGMGNAVVEDEIRTESEGIGNAVVEDEIRTESEEIRDRLSRRYSSFLKRM